MIRSLVASLLFGLFVLFGYVYYTQSFRWRNCFDETGRCFDPQTGVVYLEQSGITWITLTLLALVGFVLCLWSLRLSKPR